MQSLTELNDDELLHILFFVPDAYTYLSLLSTCSRIRYIASTELEKRWCSFYAHRFYFSEFELSTIHSGLYEQFIGKWVLFMLRMNISNPNMGVLFSNWRMLLEQRLSKILALKQQCLDQPLHLPAPNSASSVTPSGVMPMTNSMVVSHVRMASDPNSSRGTVPLTIEALKSVLVLLSDYQKVCSMPIDILEDRIRLVFRMIEGTPTSSSASRFRSLLRMEGLDIMASALSYLITLGSSYNEAQRLIMGVFFVMEMTSETNPRPVRPIGLILPLRYQLIESTKVDNQRLALSLLARYNQHDETLNNFLPVLDLVAPLAPWLFDNASPAVACSASILSSLETTEGHRMLRAIPHISERIIHLLSWTSNSGVISSCLGLVTVLDANELVALDIIPILTQLVRAYYNFGLEGFILMCLLNLETLILSPAAIPTLPSSGLLNELVSILKATGGAIRHRHTIQAILAVLRKLFRPHQPENVANAISKQFRALSGPQTFQELIAEMDRTRRVSSQVMLEQLTKMTSPNQNDTPSSELMEIDELGTLDGALIPVHASGALDHLDLVGLLYQTLNSAIFDLLDEQCVDQNDRLEQLTADLLWVPLTILHHPNETDFLDHCLEYLSTLTLALPLSTVHQTHIGNMVLHLLRILNPSCSPSHSLISISGLHNHPPGSGLLNHCLILANALIQQTETLHDGSQSFTEAIAQFVVLKRRSSQQLDPTLLASLMAFTIHAISRGGIDVTMLKIIHHLVSIQLQDVYDSGLELEFAMLEAMLWAKCEVTNATLKVPELIVPQNPLKYWISLQPMVAILESPHQDVAQIGLLGLASFVSTPKGRQLACDFISENQSSIQMAQSRSISNSIFWKRIVDLAYLFPDQ